jgi:fermentation-respiration switch protein FrsA (DUF1100 family)
MPISFLDRPEVLRVIFHPRRLYSPAYSTATIRLVEVEPEAGTTLGGRLFPAGAGSPAILYFHGNGEIAADYDDIAPFYTRIGITLLVMDYRGYGRSSGTPTVGTLLSDAAGVFQSLDRLFEQNALDPSSLFVMGRSLGSAAAIEVAVHGEKLLDGLIIESGFADTFGLLARIGGIKPPQEADQEDGFTNLAKISQVSLPTLIIHGQNDMLIPYTDGQQLYEKSSAAQKRLVLIPGAGHNDIMFAGREDYFKAIEEFTRPAPGV